MTPHRNAALTSVDVVEVSAKHHDSLCLFLGCSQRDARRSLSFDCCCSGGPSSLSSVRGAFSLTILLPYHGSRTLPQSCAASVAHVCAAHRTHLGPCTVWVRVFLRICLLSLEHSPSRCEGGLGDPVGTCAHVMLARSFCHQSYHPPSAPQTSCLPYHLHDFSCPAAHGLPGA